MAGRRVLVTGGNGFIGRRVVAVLAELGGHPWVFDLDDDVLDARRVAEFAARTDLCVHLAAHKHAPAGECHPVDIADLNVRGTRNVIAAFGERCVVASTCKAADPMTVYGASKLIAERVALNAGARVVRFVNVLGSSGSVLELWARLPPGEPLPVTGGVRLLMTAGEAAALAVGALGLPPGRYALAGLEECSMRELAERAFPGRMVVDRPHRRGDRVRERLTGEYERVTATGDPAVVRIEHPADRHVTGGLAPVTPDVPVFA